MDRLYLVFSALDFAVDEDGRWIFLGDLNPNGQWGWIEGYLPELRITAAIADVLQHFHDGSWSRVKHAPDGWRVVQGGPRRLWDELEDARQRWRDQGSPTVEAYRVAFDGEMIVSLGT
jgi:hypothetical protein